MINRYSGQWNSIMVEINVTLIWLTLYLKYLTKTYFSNFHILDIIMIIERKSLKNYLSYPFKLKLLSSTWMLIDVLNDFYLFVLLI